MSLGTIVAVCSEVGVLVSALAPIVIFICKISNGMKCQLRSEMLRIYYHNRESETIRQHEYENFVLLYEAYKALKGNSFVDKIYSDVKKWEVIT